MIILKKVDKHEMARRFAIGEVNSQFFFSEDEATKRETLRCLRSGDRELERVGIQSHWRTRGPFIESLPKFTSWHVATLGLDEAQFLTLRTVSDAGWMKYTNGSRKLVDAARFLHLNPDADRRVRAIVEAHQHGQAERCGITLLGKRRTGPFTIVEGTGRLIALYLTNIHAKPPLGFELKEIEIVVGLSWWNWRERL